MKITLQKNVADKLWQVQNSTAQSIVEMAREIGENPATFFEGDDWSGLDLRPCDLKGVSFAQAMLDRAIVYDDQYSEILASGPRSFKNPEIHTRPKLQNRPKTVEVPTMAEPFRKNFRMTMSLNESSRARLDQLSEKTEAHSSSEVVRRALHLYGILVEEVEQGSELQLKKPDGEIVLLKLL